MPCDLDDAHAGNPRRHETLDIGTSAGRLLTGACLDQVGERLGRGLRDGQQRVGRIHALIPARGSGRLMDDMGGDQPRAGLPRKTSGVFQAAAPVLTDRDADPNRGRCANRVGRLVHGAVQGRGRRPRAYRLVRGRCLRLRGDPGRSRSDAPCHRVRPRTGNAVSTSPSLVRGVRCHASSTTLTSVAMSSAALRNCAPSSLVSTGCSPWVRAAR